MALDRFSPVFERWILGKQIGSGSDGKVYRLTCKTDSETQKSIVKIIRFDYERLASSNPECEQFSASAKQAYCNAVLKNITDNIDLIMKTDKGRFFTAYNEWELRESEDSKSCLLLVRMEPLTPLSEFIADFTFTPQEVLRLAICICQSLDKCRDFGYVYPNLKPENIMFDSQGRGKLGDFGTFSCTEPLKNSISYRRTQQYMAPEFYSDGTLGTTCDTYSLGLVMYALLNRNRLPFYKPFPAEVTMSESSEALKRRISGEEFEAAKFAPPEVTRIIAKATAFDVKDRYETPKQMLNDLMYALDGKPAHEDYVEPGLTDVIEDASPQQPEAGETPAEDGADLLETYEAEYKRAEQLREQKIARQRQLREQQSAQRTKKPDLSKVVTYNYNEKRNGLLGKIPSKVLLGAVIALFVVIAVIVGLAVHFSGADTETTTAVIVSVLGHAGISELFSANFMLM